MPEILTVTPNPALDVATSTPRVEPTHKLRCAPAREFPGGGGVNVARVLRRLGRDVAALCPLGGATGARLRALLEHEGVACISVPIEGETRETVAVIEERTGAEYRFVLPGPTLREAEWRAVLDAVEAARPAPRWVVASGSAPPGVPEDFFARVARSAHRAGALVALDTSGPQLAAALAGGVVELVKPSLRELCELTGEVLGDLPSQAAAARALVTAGRAARVVVSLGAQGAVLATREGLWHAPPPDVSVVSTTGAGDSLMAAVVDALARELSPPEALARGVAAGSAALAHGGTTLCAAVDVDLLAARVLVRAL